MSDSQPNKFLIGRELTRCITVQSKEPYFMIDFNDLEIEPSHYSLRHYSSLPSEFMRNWILKQPQKIMIKNGLYYLNISKMIQLKRYLVHVHGQLINHDDAKKKYYSKFRIE